MDSKQQSTIDRSAPHARDGQPPVINDVKPAPIADATATHHQNDQPNQPAPVPAPAYSGLHNDQSNDSSTPSQSSPKASAAVPLSKTPPHNSAAVVVILAIIVIIVLLAVVVFAYVHSQSVSTTTY